MVSPACAQNARVGRKLCYINFEVPSLEFVDTINKFLVSVLYTQFLAKKIFVFVIYRELNKLSIEY